MAKKTVKNLGVVESSLSIDAILDKKVTRKDMVDLIVGQIEEELKEKMEEVQDARKNIRDKMIKELEAQRKRAEKKLITKAKRVFGVEESKINIFHYDSRSSANLCKMHSNTFFGEISLAIGNDKMEELSQQLRELREQFTILQKQQGELENQRGKIKNQLVAQFLNQSKQGKEMLKVLDSFKAKIKFSQKFLEKK